MVGSKAWFFYPPGQMEASDIPDPLADFNAWLGGVLPTLPESRKPIGCLQSVGEVVYMPPGWVHATMNVGETVGVGVQGGYNYELRLGTAKAGLKVQWPSAVSPPAASPWHLQSLRQAWPSDKQLFRCCAVECGGLVLPEGLRRGRGRQGARHP